MTHKKKFTDLGLSERSIEAINKKGFEEPTTIQALTIPVMLKDEKNIIAQAQTGTGKTAAFGLPLIQLIDHKLKAVQALVLVPTRELAIQVSEEINSLKGDKDIKIMPIYGGQSIDQQLRRLKKGIHIVVGTPGRVIDHLNRRTLKIDKIDHLILDEADEMLNMGFVEDMEEIMKYTNQDKRTLLFSATMPERIRTLAHKYMDGYELLVAKKEKVVSNLTEQIYFEVKHSAKFEALCRIIDIADNFYGLVFCRTRIDVDEVALHLMDRGYDAEAIHGDISQAQRERTLKKFRTKKINILVATDVAARGIDVDNLTHVINYSLPQNADAYIHRIGRTGRAGKEGTAITFITSREYKQLMYIKQVTKNDIRKSEIPRVEDIIRIKKKRIIEDLSSCVTEKINKEYYNIAKKLLKERTPTEVVAAALSYCFDNELNPENYETFERIAPRGKQLDQQGKTRLFIASGKKDRLNVKKLITIITDRVEIKSKEISDIQVMEKFSFITVPFNKAEEIITAFREKGQKQQLVTHAKKAKKR